MVDGVEVFNWVVIGMKTLTNQMETRTSVTVFPSRHTFRSGPAIGTRGPSGIQGNGYHANMVKDLAGTCKVVDITCWNFHALLPQICPEVHSIWCFYVGSFEISAKGFLWTTSWIPLILLQKPGKILAGGDLLIIWRHSG